MPRLVLPLGSLRVPVAPGLPTPTFPTVCSAPQAQVQTLRVWSPGLPSGHQCPQLSYLLVSPWACCSFLPNGPETHRLVSVTPSYVEALTRGVLASTFSLPVLSGHRGWNILSKRPLWARGCPCSQVSDDCLVDTMCLCAWVWRSNLPFSMAPPPLHALGSSTSARSLGWGFW